MLQFKNVWIRILVVIKPSDPLNFLQLMSEPVGREGAVVCFSGVHDGDEVTDILRLEVINLQTYMR